jgi:cytochrome bd-type quinol oxidase subunit 2
MDQRLKKQLIRSYLRITLSSISLATIATVIVYNSMERRNSEFDEPWVDLSILLIHQIIFCVFALCLFSLNSKRTTKNAWAIGMLIVTPSIPIVLSIFLSWFDYLMREEITRASLLLTINSIISFVILIWNYTRMKKLFKECKNEELSDN